MIFKCEDCGHEWWPRKENPVRCPRCQKQNIGEKQNFKKEKKNAKSRTKSK